MSAQTGFQAVTGYLEREGVPFEVVEHERTESAAAEARAAGMPADDVAKTVVLRDETGYRLAVIPASRRLDLGKVRDLLGETHGLRLVSESEMASDFGVFEVGALPPFAPMIEAVELMDESLLDHDRILCGAGDHEHGVLLDPLDLVRAGQARVADICEDWGLLVEHEGRRPTVADSAYVAPSAVLCGEVTVGEDARILFGAVVTAEGGPVEIGDRCIVMENAVVRGREAHPVRVGDHVLVGPHAHVNGAQIEDDVFLATGVSVFPGARIGKGCEVRINGVVHVNSVLRPGVTVPIGWIAVGDPAELFPPEAHEELWPIQRRMDFPGTVFGIERAELTMEKVARRYAERFGRHREDRVLD